MNESHGVCGQCCPEKARERVMKGVIDFSVRSYRQPSYECVKQGDWEKLNSPDASPAAVGRSQPYERAIAAMRSTPSPP
jgi:hypothetical protein